MKITLALTKTFLGLLLAGVLAFVFYLASIPIITSVLSLVVVNGILLIVLSTGIGASIGGFVGWLDSERTLVKHAALYGISAAGGLIGAYIGLQQGIEIAPLHNSWEYGLPTLSLTIRGAVIGANLPQLLVWIFDNLPLPLRGQLKRALRF